MLLPQRIAATCFRKPDATAVLHVAGNDAGACNTTLSYNQLHKRAAAVAATLDADGPVDGAVVAVLLDEAPGSVIAELGILYAGAAFVPLDPGAPPARICYQLADCGACAVIHSRAQTALAQALLEHDDAQICRVRTVELESTFDVAEGQRMACMQAREKVKMLQESDVCHVIYTSGSTGKPKGVVCEHGALREYADAKLKAHNIDEHARVLLVSAATWDPSVGDAFSTFACGATLVTAPRARLVQDLAAVLDEGAVSHVCTTPALWGILPATVNWKCFPALRVVALGGERLPSALIRQWRPTVHTCKSGHQCKLLNTYGVTEATVYQTVGECCEDRPGSVGRPLPGVVCAVAAPPGEVGEIWIGGPLLARGYLKAPDLTAQKFITVSSGGRQDRDNHSCKSDHGDSVSWLTPGRWFRTGDLGRWHGASTAVTSVPNNILPGSDVDEPVLELMGRIDSQIKLRGFRIELGEVESVLTAHTLVGDAAVVLYTDNNIEACGSASAESSNQRPEPEQESEPEPELELEPAPQSEPRLIAYVTLCDGVAADAWTNGGAEVAVRIHCRRQLPAHAIPTQFVRLDSLPLTTSGKIDRQVLPQPPLLRSRGILPALPKRVMTTMEATVAEAWAAALSISVDEINLEDNFFQLGGTSVQAVAMVKQLEVAHRHAQGTPSEQADWSHHDPRVRYCALFRKPRLVDYAAFLEWVAVAAPTRSASDHSTFASRFRNGSTSGTNTDHSASGPLDPEELLSLMDQVLPGADDEVALLNAALKRAAAGGYDLVISALLQAKAQPDAGHTKKDRGDTPLILAAGAGHSGAVRALILGGAAPNLPDSSARTAAHLVAGTGQVELLRWMLTKGGAGAEVKDVNKWTLSHFAAWHGKTEVLEMLLRLKAAQSLALAHERRQRTSGMVSEVDLQLQLDVLKHDEHALLGHAPHLLSSSVDGSCTAVPVNALKEAALAAEESLGSILEWAAGRIQSGVRRDWSFVIDARDRWHRTPLSWAVFQNHVEAAQVLIDGGAKFDWHNPYPSRKLKRNNNRWNTSLHLAVQATINDADACAAAAPLTTCTDGLTNVSTLSMGHLRQIQGFGETDAHCSRFATLHLLLQQPEVLSNLDTADNDGRTALHEASSLVFVDAIKASYAAAEEDAAGRSDPTNAIISQIQSLMAQAACAVRLLLDAQASVDATDHTGFTPLHYAVQAGQTAAVNVLLAAGAKVTRTPIVATDESLYAGAKSLSTQVSALGRRARRDAIAATASMGVGDQDQGAASEARQERLARRARLHELEPRLHKVLTLYALNEPLVASVLSARFEKVWGEPLRPKDYGYNKLSTLLRALPQLCEVSVIQSTNSASAPRLLVKLAGSNATGAELMEATRVERTGNIAPREEDWPGQKLFRRKAADLLAQAQER